MLGDKLNTGLRCPMLMLARSVLVQVDIRNSLRNVVSLQTAYRAAYGGRTVQSIGNQIFLCLSTNMFNLPQGV